MNEGDHSGNANLPIGAVGKDAKEKANREIGVPGNANLPIGGDHSGNANLPIGAVGKDANQEIGVPRETS